MSRNNRSGKTPSIVDIIVFGESVKDSSSTNKSKRKGFAHDDEDDEVEELFTLAGLHYMEESMLDELDQDLDMDDFEDEEDFDW